MTVLDPEWQPKNGWESWDVFCQLTMHLPGKVVLLLMAAAYILGWYLL